MPPGAQLGSRDATGTAEIIGRSNINANREDMFSLTLEVVGFEYDRFELVWSGKTDCCNCGPKQFLASSRKDNDIYILIREAEQY